VNTQGQITSWNPAAEVLLGHTAGQAIGQTLALLIPAEHRTRHISALPQSTSFPSSARPRERPANAAHRTHHFRVTLPVRPERAARHHH
jgi:PAS domain S-box-containing protein